MTKKNNKQSSSEERDYKQEIVYRSGTINRDAIDEENRTITLSFSSDEPVARFDLRNGEHFEVLGHEEGEIDQSFISSGRAPLLLNHDQKNQIGVVQSVEVSEGRSRALVKVSKSIAATEIWQDVIDGIRGNASVGYLVLQQEEEKEKRDGIKVMRVTQWRPIEVSLVSIPADESVGVGRSQTEGDAEEKTNNVKEITKMTEKKDTPTVDVEAVTREARSNEQARIRDINSIASTFGLEDKAVEFINNEKEASDFRDYALEVVAERTAKAAVKETRQDNELDLTKKEVKQFSVTRILRAMASPTSLKLRNEAAYELEVSQASMDLCGIEREGITIPHAILTRVLTAGGAATGEEFVGDDIQGGSLIELLRNKALVASLGVTSMSGLRGNVSIPKHITSGTAGWLDPENTAASDSTQGTGNVQLTPKTIGGSSEISRQFQNQSSVNAEQFVINDLLAAIGLAVDLAVFYGSGAAGQPSGIENQVTQVVTRFAGAVPTRNEIIILETEVDTGNALVGNLHYVTDPGTRGALKNTTEDAGSGQFVWKSDNTLNGYDAQVSSQITSGDVFFGNFADVIVASWGGLSVQLDPFTGGRAGTIRVNVLQDADIAIRHLESFAYNNDTA